MSNRKSYPLRINADILRAMQIWADNDLRSLNAQIEFVLRSSLSMAGRIKIAKSEIQIVNEEASKGQQDKES